MPRNCLAHQERQGIPYSKKECVQQLTQQTPQLRRQATSKTNKTNHFVFMIKQETARAKSL